MSMHKEWVINIFTNLNKVHKIDVCVCLLFYKDIKSDIEEKFYYFRICSGSWISSLFYWWPFSDKYSLSKKSILYKMVPNRKW